MERFQVTVYNQDAIRHLKSLGRYKAKYIEELIIKDLQGKFELSRDELTDIVTEVLQKTFDRPVEKQEVDDALDEFAKAQMLKVISGAI